MVPIAADVDRKETECAVAFRRSWGTREATLRRHLSELILLDSKQSVSDRANSVNTASEPNNGTTHFAGLDFVTIKKALGNLGYSLVKRVR